MAPRRAAQIGRDKRLSAVTTARTALRKRRRAGRDLVVDVIADRLGLDPVVGTAEFYVLTSRTGVRIWLH
jgi:hypothetical protein